MTEEEKLIVNCERINKITSKHNFEINNSIPNCILIIKDIIDSFPSKTLSTPTNFSLSKI